MGAFVASPPPPPPVWKWYRLYAGLMGAMYVVVVVLGFAMAAFLPARADDPPPWFMGLLFGCIGGPLAVAFLAVFVVPVKPWAWIYHLVLICIGMTSACCLPACIPLLIYWIKPETKRFFGRE